jgi:predicted Holliday junction resolvase-like endonuclease
MDGWQIALVVLAALLVGSLLPLVVQLYGVIHTLRTAMEKSAKDVEAALVAIHHTADRVDRLGAALEKDGKMTQIVEGAATAAHLVSQVRSTMQIAGTVSAAVVPAVAAAVRAWKGAMEDEDPSPPAPAGHGSPETSSHEEKEATG